LSVQARRIHATGDCAQPPLHDRHWLGAFRGSDRQGWSRRGRSRRLGRWDLSGCDLYTTCEPCELCVAAMFWAKISRLYYANSLADYENIGFDLKPLTALVRTNLHSGALKAERVLPDEARSVLDEWRALPTFSGFQ